MVAPAPEAFIRALECIHHIGKPYAVFLGKHSGQGQAPLFGIQRLGVMLSV